MPQMCPTFLRGYFPRWKTLLPILALALPLTLSAAAEARKGAPKTDEFLVKLKPDAMSGLMAESFILKGTDVEETGLPGWISLKVSAKNTKTQLQMLNSNAGVEYVQPNFKLHLPENYQIQDKLKRKAIMKMFAKMKPMDESIDAEAADPIYTDNPEIPGVPAQTTGADPLFDHQWGMLDIGVREAWKVTHGDPKMIVAVIDTGVDYTHEDLLPNMWRNPGETGKDANGNDKSKNQIDDDKNGFVDDVVGWDFAADDNKPYDLSTPPMKLISEGGNPGHGTHCAGNVAARGDNGKGIAGVAPNVKIMALRFITEKGEGTTEAAIKAIKYAVDNGAKVLSNSWGSEGDDPQDAANNQALKDAIKYAQDKGVLFIAAAGNGHQGVGYDNDTDAKPGVPASYPIENIISVAAIDNQDQLGSFSNWGLKTVHIGAPGVNVFSTTVGSHYADKVFDKYGVTVAWDGTSMATPHVAGAAALYWSAHPEKSWRDVKDAILRSATKIPALANKCVSEGKLNVAGLLAQ